jgi:hypothetical protein
LMLVGIGIEWWAAIQPCGRRTAAWSSNGGFSRPWPFAPGFGLHCRGCSGVNSHATP